VNRFLSAPRFVAAAAGLLATFSLTVADAATFDVSNYTALFQGIDYATADIEGGSGHSEAFVVRIDLNAPGVGFYTTPKSGPLETMSQTTSQFLQSSGAQVAINAAFFSPCGCSTTTSDAKNLSGLAISNGVQVSAGETGYASLLLTQNNLASLVDGSANTPTDGIWTAISGGGFVLKNGVNVVGGSLPGDPLNPNPRSVLGLSQDAAYMYLVAIDGRRAGWSAGVTQSEESALMFYLGAYNAINLDGGGSTALVVEGADGLPHELNQPSSNAERYNGNNFGVYANALPAPVPLPAGVWLLGSGLASLAMAARRRRLATTA
jgi:exopolysaccharide biosynthesis protein